MEFFEVDDIDVLAAKTQSCTNNGCVQSGCSDTNCTQNGCVNYYPCGSGSTTTS